MAQAWVSVSQSTNYDVGKYVEGNKTDLRKKIWDEKIGEFPKS